MLKSSDGGEPCWVQFVNSAGASVTASWVDYKGKEVEYAKLEPGQSFAQRECVCLLPEPVVVT
jgi:hypothetical protein